MIVPQQNRARVPPHWHLRLIPQSLDETVKILTERGFVCESTPTQSEYIYFVEGSKTIILAENPTITGIYSPAEEIVTNLAYAAIFEEVEGHCQHGCRYV